MSDLIKNTNKSSVTMVGKNKEQTSLSQRDQKHIWHPLTQYKLSPGILPIVKAKGAVLYDENGKD